MCSTIVEKYGLATLCTLHKVQRYAGLVFALSRRRNYFYQQRRLAIFEMLDYCVALSVTLHYLLAGIHDLLKCSMYDNRSGTSAVFINACVEEVL